MLNNFSYFSPLEVSLGQVKLGLYLIHTRPDYIGWSKIQLLVS